MFTDEQRAKLSQMLSPSAVRTRSAGSGPALSYIEAHHAIRTMNDIFGPEWNRETIYCNLVSEGRYQDKYNNEMISVTYAAKVRVTIGDVVKEGTGYGHGFVKADKGGGEAHESAGKEAESDAMKRALMMLGDPLGLALYDKKQTHVGDGEPEAKTDPKPARKTLTAAEVNKILKEAKTMDDLYNGSNGYDLTDEQRRRFREAAAKFKQAA